MGIPFSFNHRVDDNALKNQLKFFSINYTALPSLLCEGSSNNPFSNRLQ
jgi:hypothetical protein